MTETFRALLGTDSAGRRFVGIPICSGEQCATCGGCGRSGAVPEPLIVDNVEDCLAFPDGTEVRVTVERANPALLAVVLFLVPLFFLGGGAALGNYYWADWGLVAGGTAGFIITLVWWRLGQKYWRALRVTVNA